MGAVNFHFFPDFDVADGTLVQYSVDFPSLFFFPSAVLHRAEMLCIYSVFGCGFSSKNNPKNISSLCSGKPGALV